MEKKEGVDGRSRALTMKAILFKLGLKAVQHVPRTQGQVVRLGTDEGITDQAVRSQWDTT